MGNSEQVQYSGYNYFFPPTSDISGTKNGIDYTIYADGRIKLNGTSSKYTEIQYSNSNNIAIYAGTYTFTNGTSNNNSLTFYYSSSGAGTWQFNNFATHTKETDYLPTSVILQISEGSTFSNQIFKPMLLNGTYSPSNVPEYEPYVRSELQAHHQTIHKK